MQATTTTETLLGMLSLGPMSGYELRNLIAGSIGNFWSESFGQIYPALKRMEAAGLVEGTDVPAGARARRVYRLTEEGRGRLGEWLGLPAREQVPRNELLLKLFFGAGMESAQVRGLLEAKRAELRVDLARYEAIERSLRVERAGQPGLPFWLMTVRYGMAQSRALLGWCEESFRALDAMEAGRTGHGASCAGGKPVQGSDPEERGDAG